MFKSKSNKTFTNKEVRKNALDNFKASPSYNLSSTYFRASSAKDDYVIKAKFIQNDLIPSVNEWRVSIDESNEKLSEEKLMVATKLVNITEFLLNDFYGPFALTPTALEISKYRDFSMFTLSEAMVELNLDFSDLNKTNIEIGRASCRERV